MSKLPNKQVIDAAILLFDFTLDNLGQAARERDASYSFYHPAKLADELRMFLDVFHVQKTKFVHQFGTDDGDTQG